MQTKQNVLVDGKEYMEVHDDLFIPPHALHVLLDSFSGPLDLLLYLIRKQDIDILNIPMALITQQYLQYIAMLESRTMELAADYLLMAAVLAEIKSRMLLPSTGKKEEEQEEDPRMALVRRLQAYEQIKQGAELLDALPRQDREYFSVRIDSGALDPVFLHPEVDLEELLALMKALLQKQEQGLCHEIAPELLSVRERMGKILELLQEGTMLQFNQLFTVDEGRSGLIVSFLALLELARQSLLSITQTQAFSPIHVKAA